MRDINIAIIEELKNFVAFVRSDRQLLSKFTTTKSAFSRDRKLPFQKLVVLIASLCKKTLSFELEQFFSQITDASLCCSVSAFCQQRAKLDPYFFYCWNLVLWHSFYEHGKDQVKRWNGFRLIAADGSTVTLTNNHALREHFGGQSNQKGFYVGARTFYLYDLLNGLILHARLAPYRASELMIAYDQVQGLGSSASDMLLIYDRNFCSFKMAALHLWAEREIKFVIRVKDYRFMKEFVSTGEKSAVITMIPTPEAIEGLKQSGYIITSKTTIEVRVVRVDLADGRVEVLMTNLWEGEGYSSQMIAALYSMRWGIETNIGFQKNIGQLESFSGLTVRAVEQDFFATILIANLYHLLLGAVRPQAEAKSRPGQIYPHKINNNKAFGYLKPRIADLFINSEPEQILYYLYGCFLRHTLPVRKERHFERKRKNIHGKSKFKTFPNFKPAF